MLNPKIVDVSRNKPIPQPIEKHSSGLKITKKSSSHKILSPINIIVAIILGIVIGGLIWYKVQLQPVGNDISQFKKVTVVSGSTPNQIGQELEKQSIIRSATAFDIYVRLSGNGSRLQAGTYRLSPAETTSQIVRHLVNGLVDRFNITFYPGDTLANTKKILEKAGYSDTEINIAFNKPRSDLLFTDKPSSADLEGYIYGDTYNFNTGATVEEILQRTFDEFYTKVKDNNLVADFASHGLNLYQGIILASIIQREVSSPSNQNEATQDQKQVAQVFYSRLNSGMVLGSDVTYQYIADKTGVARDPNLDSPYNTRIYKGLPPGPISTPSLSALLAVAHPASGDYLYFLSGDDDTIYFAHTYAEHEANITNHCKIKCSAL